MSRARARPRAPAPSHARTPPASRVAAILGSCCHIALRLVHPQLRPLRLLAARPRVCAAPLLAGAAAASPARAASSPALPAPAPARCLPRSHRGLARPLCALDPACPRRHARRSLAVAANRGPGRSAPRGSARRARLFS
nr:putative hydro-lyase KRH_21160 [Aegilops tauschii subsp. strangulata]